MPDMTLLFKTENISTLNVETKIRFYTHNPSVHPQLYLRVENGKSGKREWKDENVCCCCECSTFDIFFQILNVKVSRQQSNNSDV